MAKPSTSRPSKTQAAIDEERCVAKGKEGGGGAMYVAYEVGGEGGRARMLICDGHGLDDEDARASAELLSPFNRLSRQQ